MTRPVNPGVPPKHPDPKKPPMGGIDDQPWLPCSWCAGLGPDCVCAPVAETFWEWQLGRSQAAREAEQRQAVRAAFRAHYELVRAKWVA